jgi:hypothetical protein
MSFPHEIRQKNKEVEMISKKGFLWIMIGVIIIFCAKALFCGTIRGNVIVKVIDEETKKGIEGVTIYLGNERWGETNKFGYFYFKNIYPSIYALRYEAPFPYVAQMINRDKLEPAGDDYVKLSEGENKYIVKTLKKGGGVKGKIQLEGVEKINFKTAGVFIHTYKVENDGETYKDPISGTVGMYEIDFSSKVEEDGRYEIVGLPEGKIITVVKGMRGVKPEERYYFPGKLNIVDIKKGEWAENVDFHLEENKEENANLKITIISSVDNRIFKDADVSVKKRVKIWEKEFAVELYSDTKQGERAGIFYFVLEPGEYVFYVGVSKYGLTWRDEFIKGENWDEKNVEIDIIKDQKKEITVYF